MTRTFQLPIIRVFFFFTDPATTEIYTLSLHDALPICCAPSANATVTTAGKPSGTTATAIATAFSSTKSNDRSEEHTSELQSQFHLVCRLLLEKKKLMINSTNYIPTKNVCENCFTGRLK